MARSTDTEAKLPREAPALWVVFTETGESPRDRGTPEAFLLCFDLGAEDGEPGKEEPRLLF